MKGNNSDYVYILGVPNFAHYESSASLMRIPRNGGEVDYVCVSEDRLNRQKNTYIFPLRGIGYCMQEFGLVGLNEIDHIVTDYARIPRWHNSGPAYRKLEHDYLKLKLDYPLDRIQIIDHHDSHASSCYYPSGFDEAAVLIVDGMGSELETQSLYHARGNEISLLERGYDWGIGKLYALITDKVLPYGPEKGFGKVMGLAPFGADQPGPVLKFDCDARGVKTDYSAFYSRQPVSRLIAEGIPHCDDRTKVMEPEFVRAAYDIQQECEQQLIRMARYAYEKTGCENLCLAGGVILNGLANHRILEQTPIKRIWMPPCVNDSGMSFGLSVWGAFNLVNAEQSISIKMPNAYTGHSYSDEEVLAILKEFNIDWLETTPEEIGQEIADGKIIGWFLGASEFGPRALGHRSILADPRSLQMKDRLNSGVKFREGYRPYAPSVLQEYAAEWFDLLDASPFMLHVCSVKNDKRHLVPAVTHIDGTARVQEVSKEQCREYWELINSFRQKTNVPMVLNTSFNLNREPIVETPIDALICGFGTGIDLLVLNGKFRVTCDNYRSPALHRTLDINRQKNIDREYESLCDRFLVSYDASEMKSFLDTENAKARWYLSAAIYELDRFIHRVKKNDLRVLIVGTLGHTSVLYNYVAEFVEIPVVGFVDIEKIGELGNWVPPYPKASINQVKWNEVDVVLVSTHEYQREASEIVMNSISTCEVVTLYDTAMDSLFYLLPELRSPVRGGRPVPAKLYDTRDIEDVANLSNSEVLSLGQRYGFAISYHYIHDTKEAVYGGLNHITPDMFHGQMSQLVDNFSFSTVSQLLEPNFDARETTALLTFDDGLKDVVESVHRLLAEFEIRGTVFVSSRPYTEKDPLMTHKRQLVAGKIGFDRVCRALNEYLENEKFDLTGLVPPDDTHRFDTEQVRRTKWLLSYYLPYEVSERFINKLFDNEFDRKDVVKRLYLSIDDLLRLQDLGWEIGGHGHDHRAYSTMSESQQRNDMSINYEFIADTLERKPKSFAYPYGSASSYNENTINALEEVGFESSCVVSSEIIRPHHLRRRFEIPRFNVLDLFDGNNALNTGKIAVLSSGD